MKSPKAAPALSAFTLVEVMVSTVIVVILAGILISATDMIARSFARTSAKIEQFSEARRGFEAMTRRLAEATLNTYFDYYDASGQPRPIFNGDPGSGNYQSSRDFVPMSYGRQSELRFVSGPMTKLDPAASGFDRPTHGIFFQAPAGEVEDRDAFGVLDQSLNSWGYFLEISDDTAFVPQILTGLVEPRRRSRLLEFRQPTEQNRIYWPLDLTTPPENQTPDKRNWWFIQDIDKTTSDRPVRVVAENVIALIIVPRLARQDEIARATRLTLSPGDDKGVLSPNYTYDSVLSSNHTPPLNDAEVNPRNQLPPVVQVVMVALDEPSAARLDELTKEKEGFDLKLEEIFERSVELEDNPSTPEANDGELSELETRLIDMKLAYRVFSTNVIIRGAKWSRAQTK